MGNNLNDKYFDSIKFCEGKGVSSRFAQIYPFTTENITGYIDKFDLNGKSLVTVGSSCDQVINAAIKGCEDATIIDICPFTKDFFYLKKAAILVLSYEEFQKYLCYRNFFNAFNNNDDVMNKKSFLKLKQTLKDINSLSHDFWNELYTDNDPINIRKILFSYDEEDKSVLKETNLYLMDEFKYNECKKVLEKFEPKIINKDVFEVEFNRTFDNIWLSNLPQYLNNEQIKKLVDRMICYLNEEGKMLISYLFQTQKNTEYYSDYAPIYNLQEIYKIFKGYLIELETFTGVDGILHDMECKKDSILVYKK